jgi:hypothetical protein
MEGEIVAVVDAVVGLHFEEDAALKGLLVSAKHSTIDRDNTVQYSVL